jgi:hypothetical protein
MTETKGKESVEYLKKNFTSYKGFKINYLIINDKIPPYHENEFFQITKKYNFHGLFYLNKWGETWCYCLTKGLASGLPILYNNYGSFKERIPQQENYFKVNEFEEKYYDFDHLGSRFIDFLEYIIKNNGKNTEINVNPQFEIENKYDEIFYKRIIPNKNLVIITSKIIVSKNAFTYTENRSVYSKEERFQQTLKTINSIRNYLENAFIILVDNSKFSNQEFKILERLTDYFHNIIDNDDLNYYTDICSSKCLAESAQIYNLWESYLNKIDISKVDNIFKISGRYEITQEISKETLNIDKNIFKKNLEVIDRDYYYTCFYKIYKTYFKNYFKAQDNIIKNPQKNFGIDLEVILPKELEYNFLTVDNLNILQRISAWNVVNIV